MNTSFNEKFDRFWQWRRGFANRLEALNEWLLSHELMNSAVQEQIQQLESKIRSDKVTIAFVAEFSRGKSELINAIFFAHYGRRIMPASAGRTTMCPTELGYDAEQSPCLRLLSIETRLESRSLAQWRLAPQAWETFQLVVDDAEQLARTFEKVSETKKVNKDQARKLGFWHDGAPEDMPPEDAQGMIEIPRWRHALINIPHPLLKQGLIILDTPGLNAIGAEPELTVNLLPQANAIIFILGADTGVTRSDLTIWREHLMSSSTNDTRLVVLNKIDTLWNSLNTPAQVAVQIERQRITTAETLGVPLENVLAVSAQKGLTAKISHEKRLLAASALTSLEDLLSRSVMDKRQDILRASANEAISELRAAAGAVINLRRTELDDQMHELTSLRGKNANVINTMRKRLLQERKDFVAQMQKTQDFRNEHIKSLREMFSELSANAVMTELQDLTDVLQQRGLKLGAKAAYDEAFARLQGVLDGVAKGCQKIHGTLDRVFRQLNTDMGFALKTPSVPKFQNYLDGLERIRQSHIQYLSIGNRLRLADAGFAERVERALSARVRTGFEFVASDLEMWSKSATAQLDVQMRDRLRNFEHRLEAIDRIQGAAHTLSDHIVELEWKDAELIELGSQLLERTAELVVADAEEEEEEELRDGYPCEDFDTGISRLLSSQESMIVAPVRPKAVEKYTLGIDINLDHI